ncbi:MAG: ABC transporter ATP-binding protein [Gammaproteobacteria bacterium]|nr:ABC transporter ATP-binding protein [Gammaproteobacteria bacterium]
MCLLKTNRLAAHYNDFQALFAVDLHLDAGETVAIIGANGAGKTTLLRSLCGALANAPEQIVFDGEPVGALSAEQVVRRGIAMVPEGRKLFPSLSVEENLQIGGYAGGAGGFWNLAKLYELFPVLGERRRQPATRLSGGQQQMVAIGRALMSNPKVLLCDEISLGLAPAVIRDIYNALPGIRSQGAGVILVEQDISRALSAANRFYCIMEGRVTLSGEPENASRDAIHDAYFGVGA